MAQTPHYRRVDSLMEQAGQGRPNIPTVPDEATRLLRAKLIFEEAIRELLYEGLGVNIRIKGDPESLNGPEAKKQDLIVFETHDGKTKLEPNLTLIADGCIDTSVVTIGTLIACGIDDKELLELVDNNNLAKFGIPKCDKCGNEMQESGPHPTNPSIPMFTCDVCYKASKGGPGVPVITGGYRNPEGKWIKPSNHRPPDIAAELERQKQEKLEYLRGRPKDMAFFDEAESIDSKIFEGLADNPHVRRINIGAPLPDPNAFLGKALEEHRASEAKRFEGASEFRTKHHRDPRLGKRVKYQKKYHGNLYTSGTVIGSGDEAPISEPAKTGMKYLVIDDDVCFDTLWVLETEVTFVD